jgi:TRAP-type C4-dicarboxylate transport system substrate-binding protein
VKDVLRKAYVEHRVYWAAEIFQPACCVIMKKEIKSLDDLKNMKLGTLGAFRKMMWQFGASLVSMGFAEVYTSLATRVVEGNVGSQIADFRESEFHEVAKWFFPLPVAGSQEAPM